MTKDELKKKLKTEIADWWRIKFRVEQKDDICQTISDKEISELCLIIAEPREKRIAELEGQVTRAFEVLEDKRKQIQIDAEQIRALQKQNGELTDSVKELELKIKHLTEHLEPQTVSALFEQVEEEVKQEQRIKELEAQVKYWKSEYNKLFNED